MLRQHGAGAEKGGKPRPWSECYGAQGLQGWLGFLSDGSELSRGINPHLRGTVGKRKPGRTLASADSCPPRPLVFASSCTRGLPRGCPAHPDADADTVAAGGAWSDPPGRRPRSGRAGGLRFLTHLTRTGGLNLLLKQAHGCIHEGFHALPFPSRRPSVNCPAQPSGSEFKSSLIVPLVALIQKLLFSGPCR